MVTQPMARLLTLAALKAGNDPLTELGIPPELHRTPPMVGLLAQLSNPRFDPNEQEDMDEAAERVLERMDTEEAWSAALRGEYRGPRGQHQPVLRTAEPPH